MSSDRNAKWTNGKHIITGSWQYVWHKNAFRVSLNQSKYTKEFRNHDFWTSDDDVAFGKWKLIEEKK